jgi:hypothetical protein
MGRDRSGRVKRGDRHYMYNQILNCEVLIKFEDILVKGKEEMLD